MNDDSDLTNEALQLAASFVSDLFALDLPKLLVATAPNTHEKLYLLIARLEALGYMEKYRHGTVPVEH